MSQSVFPVDRTELVGRAEDLRGLEQHFEGGARLVTVCGGAGIGKSRLARAYAAVGETAGRYPGGVWFCKLTRAAGLDDMIAGIAEVLGTIPDVDAIADFLADRGPGLIILDSLDRLVSTAPETVGYWLDSAPEMSFLVTSRQLLSLSGEVRHELRPLSEESALALFIKRAESAGGVIQGQEQAIRDIVTHLDFNPLAIELAAARTSVLTPEQLKEKLTDRFAVLKDHRQDVSVRHVTLSAALDWSWEVLNTQERNLLEQCIVFRGDFDLDAAEAVLSTEGPSPLLDVLQSLRNKSWIQGRATAAGIVFRLYDNVTDYVAAQGKGEAFHSACQRHRDFYLGRARSEERERRLQQLRRDRDNLMAVYGHSLERGETSQSSSDPSDAARVVVMLGPVLSQEPWEAHLGLLDSALSVCSDGALEAELTEQRVAVLQRAEESQVEESPALEQVASDNTALIVGKDSEWFVSPGEGRVSLSRRRVLRRVLEAFVQRRIEAPGELLTLDEVLAAGWPGERVLAKAAASRVYVAIGTLRRLGLRDVLITKGEGYLLLPSVELRRES